MKFKTKKVVFKKQKAYIPRYGLRTIVPASTVGQNQKAGAYAATLIDPWTHQNSRIPDLTSIPVAVSAVNTDYTWSPIFTADATNTSCLVVDLHPIVPQYRLVQGPSGASPGTTTGSAVKFNGDGTTTGGSVRMGYGRIVSAGIRVRFAGNDSDSAGIINAWFDPGNDTAGLTPTTNYTYSLADINRKAYMASNPLRDGVTITYRPSDSSAFKMLSSGSVSNLPGAFGVFVTGRTSTCALQVSVIVNVEYVPKDDTFGDVTVGTAVNGASFDESLSIASQVEPCSNAESDIEKLRKLARSLVGVSYPKVYRTKRYKRTKYIK